MLATIFANGESVNAALRDQRPPDKTRSTIGGGGGDVTNLAPFWEETARQQPLPGTYLTNLLVKCDEFEASLPTM